jgi:hypothetical protein
MTKEPQLATLNLARALPRVAALMSAAPTSPVTHSPLLCWPYEPRLLTPVL